MRQMIGFLLLFLMGSANAMDMAALDQIGPAAQQEIEAGHVPGAVVLIGGEDGVYFEHAYGNRELKPEQDAMTEDTIFDLASLTKVVATTTAVMQLVEAGKLKLDAPAARYWPKFAANGKKTITVRQLLTHYSGLRPDLSLGHPWAGRKEALKLILQEKPAFPPGTHYAYSDINFEVLGELVERVSGMPLDVYCKRHIFNPLGMHDTGFKPKFSSRIAPTEWGRQGVVHDPSAFRMGGVAGHAGLFSTAGDLARFAQMMLAGGRMGKVRILQTKTIEQMTVPQSPSGQTRLRGLGWDIAAPFAVNQDMLPAVGAYGHKGFTGTSLWIDPVSKIFVIILTNRVHPDGKGNAGPLRDRVATIVDEAMGTVAESKIAAARPALAAYITTPPAVQSGMDVLAAQGFAPLKGKRIGLITNQTGQDWHHRRDVDLLRKAKGVRLVALFSPEHGLYGNRDEKIASGSEPTTGLPVYSLYGEVRRPTPDMLKGIDSLVFDIQDAGARFYTYTTTMAYAMEAAAKQGIPIYVLDRPNPINGEMVQGPMLDHDRISFTGYFPLPVRYGMTLGELAKFFNDEAGIGADLHVVPMEGYQRRDWYDDTGLPWVAPSPNLRSLTEAILYPGVALVEGANVSVGRGTGMPFEVVGSPWVEASTLSEYLSARKLPGVKFSPITFTPDSDRFKGKPCHGVRITVIDRDAIDSPALGIEIASALYHLYPQDFRLDETLGAIGSQSVLDALQRGDDPKEIVAGWQADLDRFRNRRSQYLIYP